MKKWLKWVLIIIGIIILLLIINYFRPRYNSETGQWCFRKGGYCVYNVPPGMLLSSPNDDLWGRTLNVQIVENITEGLSEHLIREGSSYTCMDTLEPPRIVEYFYQICGPSLKDGGCGADKRKAIICGEVYYVIDSSLSIGSYYYGPFKIGEKPELILDISVTNTICIDNLKEALLPPAETEPLGTIRYDKFGEPWTKLAENEWNGHGWSGIIGFIPGGAPENIPVYGRYTDNEGNLFVKNVDGSWMTPLENTFNVDAMEIDGNFPNGAYTPINRSKCPDLQEDITNKFTLS